ncbi:MAG: hypothetical protein GKR97_12915 [Rhizobiaceae bacterium]|nr:hypothetical protein [Rhizobiaceae bacterium]
MKFAFGLYTLDTDLVELHGPDGPVSVEPQVFTLLSYLAENSDRVVSKDELIENVWQGRIVSDANLNSRVNAARRAVNDDGKAQNVIRTFPRKGFRFVAELNDAPETNDGSPITEQRARILILPFQVRSSDPELHHVADGLAEDIILELSHSKQFTVLSRSVSFSFKDQIVDLPKLSKEHAVRYVVEGSVRSAGDTLRLSATLTDTQTSGVLWSEQIDGKGEDIFPVLDHITRRVVAAVEPTVKRMERRNASSQQTNELSAWQYYLRGSAYLFDRGIIGQTDVSTKAIEEFSKAIELDPDLAEAHAGLATAMWHLVGFSFETGRAERLREALKHATLASEIAPSNSEVLAALGTILVHLGQTDAGISALRRAGSVNDSDAHTKLYMGIALVSSGQFDEAKNILNFVISSGKQHASHGAASAWTAHALNFEGRFEEAESHARDAVANPHTQFWANVSLIVSLHNQGRCEEAANELRNMRQFRPESSCQGLAELTPVTHAPSLKLLLDTMKAVGLPEHPETSA